MIVQYGLEPVLIQCISIGFEAILEKIIKHFLLVIKQGNSSYVEFPIIIKNFKEFFQNNLLLVQLLYKDISSIRQSFNIRDPKG